MHSVLLQSIANFSHQFFQKFESPSPPHVLLLSPGQNTTQAPSSPPSTGFKNEAQPKLPASFPADFDKTPLTVPDAKKPRGELTCRHVHFADDSHPAHLPLTSKPPTHSEKEASDEHTDDTPSVESSECTVQPQSQTETAIEQRQEQHVIQRPRKLHNEQLGHEQTQHSSHSYLSPSLSATSGREGFELLHSMGKSSDVHIPILTDHASELTIKSVDTPVAISTNSESRALESTVNPSTQLVSMFVKPRAEEIPVPVVRPPASTSDTEISVNAAQEAASPFCSTLTPPSLLRQQHARIEADMVPTSSKQESALASRDEENHGTVRAYVRISRPVLVDDVQIAHSNAVTDAPPLLEATPFNSDAQSSSVAESAKPTQLDPVMELSPDIEKQVTQSVLAPKLSPVSDKEVVQYVHGIESLSAAENYVPRSVHVKESHSAAENKAHISDHSGIYKCERDAKDAYSTTSTNDGEQTQMDIDGLAMSPTPAPISQTVAFCPSQPPSSDNQSVVTAEEDTQSSAASESQASRSVPAFISPPLSPGQPHELPSWAALQTELETLSDSKPITTNIEEATSAQGISRTSEDEPSVTRADAAITEQRFVLLPSPLFVQTPSPPLLSSGFEEQPVVLELPAPAVSTKTDIEAKRVHAEIPPLTSKSNSSEIIRESFFIQRTTDSSTRTTATDTRSPGLHTSSEKSVTSGNGTDDDFIDSRRVASFCEMSKTFTEAQEHLDTERKKLLLKHEFRRKRMIAMEKKMMEARGVYLTACRRYEEKRLVVGRILRGLRDETLNTSDKRYFKLFEKNELDESLNGPSRRFLVDDDGSVCMLRQMVAKLDKENLKLQAEIDRQKGILQTMNESRCGISPSNANENFKKDIETRLVTPPCRARHESRLRPPSADKAGSHSSFVESLEKQESMEIPTRKSEKSSPSGSLRALHQKAQCLAQMSLPQGADEFMKRSPRSHVEEHSDTGTRKITKFNSRFRSETMSGNPWAALKRRSIERRLKGTAERRAKSNLITNESENVKQPRSPSRHGLMNNTSQKNLNQSSSNKPSPSSNSERKN